MQSLVILVACIAFVANATSDGEPTAPIPVIARHAASTAERMLRSQHSSQSPVPPGMDSPRPDAVDAQPQAAAQQSTDDEPIPAGPGDVPPRVDSPPCAQPQEAGQAAHDVTVDSTTSIPSQARAVYDCF